MRRIPILVLFVALAFTACESTPSGTSTVPSPTTIASPPPSFTTTATSPSTTISTFGGISVDYGGLDALRTESSGVDQIRGCLVLSSGEVVQVQGGFEVPLDMSRYWVVWAADDGHGGIVFLVGGEAVVYQLKSGSNDPLPIATDALPVEVTLVEGRSVLVVWQQSDECRSQDGRKHRVFIDLETRELSIDWDCSDLTDRSYASMGGDLRVRVVESGDVVPQRRLEFFDLNFQPVIVAGNPWPEPCHLCEIDVRLSPDGTQLALREFLPQPEDVGVADWDSFAALPLHDRIDRMEALEAHSQVQIRTVDLTSGETIYAGLWDQAGIEDYDGRYLVLRSDGIRLIDTEIGEEIPIPNPDSARHMRLLLPAVTQPVLTEPAIQLEVDSVTPRFPTEQTGVVLSGRTCSDCVVQVESVQVGVDDGGRWSVNLDLPTGPHVVSIRAIDSTGIDREMIVPVYVYTQSVELRGDGLGVVRFGDTSSDVSAILGGLLGEASGDWLEEWTGWGVGITNGFGADHYFRYMTWEQIGLGIVISDGYTLPDTRPGAVLVHWSYSPPSSDGPLRLFTPERIGVGSSVEDLRTAYGERLSVYEDEFDGWRATLPESGIVFDLTGDPSDPATTVGYLWAGAAQAP